jgi:hypothetical protein
MINRKQFRQLFNSYKPGLGEFDSPLWYSEQQGDCKPSRWFVNIRPLNHQNFKTEFWAWANKTCQGQLLCYSSNTENQEEWWGFTHRADVVLFLLKWS